MLTEQRANALLDTAIQSAHFTQRIQNALLYTDGGAAHPVHRMVDAGRHLLIHGFYFVSACPVTLAGLAVSAFAFLDTTAGLVDYVVNPASDNPGLLLHVIPHFIDIVCHFIR